MGWLDWLFGNAEPAAPVARTNGAKQLSHVRIAPGRGYTFDVVGEGNYQDALDDYCGGKCEEGHRMECEAEICFITDNPHDPNAVGVFINARLVGYIPRDMAKQMRADILRINPGQHPVLCKAKIVGGWDRGRGDEGHYGVKLSISHPMRLQ